jgi:hypothetical protein
VAVGTSLASSMYPRARSGCSTDARPAPRPAAPPERVQSSLGQLPDCEEVLGDDVNEKGRARVAGAVVIDFNTANERRRFTVFVFAVFSIPFAQFFAENCP